MGPSSCCPLVLPEYLRPLLGPFEDLAACTLVVQPDSSGGSHRLVGAFLLIQGGGPKEHKGNSCSGAVCSPPAAGLR